MKNKIIFSTIVAVIIIIGAFILSVADIISLVEQILITILALIWQLLFNVK